MILPDASWRRRDGLDALIRALGGAEGAARFVGGAVRDTLLGLPVADVDIATILAPADSRDRIQAAGFKAVPTGLAHGTITAVLPGGPIEVTTLRRDVSTDGRHAIVAFTDDWQADAARRDFTINALFADPLSGRIDDFFGGLRDLEQRRVRFIGEPRARIAEDHLRILRFFRFHARFGTGAPDAPALAACAERARDLMTLSRERIAQELVKLLAVADPVPTLRVMVDHSILTPVLPEIDSEGIARLDRLVSRETAHGLADPIRRLAALLPPTPAAETVAVRLKMSNAVRKRLALAAAPMPAENIRAFAHAVGVEGATDRLLLRDDGDYAAGLSALTGWVPPRLPIGGGDLLALGLSPGPGIAATLKRIEHRWIEEGFPGRDRVQLLAAEEAGRTGAPNGGNA